MTIRRIEVAFLFLFFMGCSESKYTDLVKKELASEVVHDSLFLGHKLGQTKQQFFRLCWELNQKKVITNGPVFPYAQYKLLSDKTGDPQNNMTMLFYGDFNEKKIMTGMKLQFYYDRWALWNKSLQSDQLVHTVKDSLKKWYPGNDFIIALLEKDSIEVFVKVDGNRRITIMPLDDNRIVKAKIDDLRYVLDKE